jgi:hypothetical protein
MHLATTGIVLSKGLSEQCWRLQVITPESGLLTCFQKHPKKTGKSVAPDLFDGASLLLKSNRLGTTHFVDEYHLLQRRTQLAIRYKNFMWATRFTKILLNNPIHTEGTPDLYTLMNTALNHWEEEKHGAAIYLKALYRLIRLEGFPVKESWLLSLPPSKQKCVLALLNTPIRSLPDEECCSHETLTSSLERWVAQHTAIHC